jgi:hypothetical protein
MKKEAKKTIRFFFLGMLGTVVIISMIVLAQDVVADQNLPDHVLVHFPDTLSGKNFNRDSLIYTVGPNKGLPEGYEEAALLALSAYPELRTVKVNMVLTQSGAPMESNFRFWSLFGSRAERIYEIRLNDADHSIFDGILLRDLPFDAQVGILAHELGHVVYYHQLSTLQIAKWGLMYLTSLGFRATHEKSTDLMPVYHGLGSQIYQYAWFVRHADVNREMYQKWGGFLDRFYLTDKEIMEEIKRISSK